MPIPQHTYKTISLPTSNFNSDKPSTVITVQQFPKVDIEVYVYRLKRDQYKIVTKVSPSLMLGDFMNDYHNTRKYVSSKDLLTKTAELVNQTKSVVKYRLKQRRS